MRFGRLNIMAGAAVIFLAAIGGFALGFTIEPNIKDGHYMLTYPRLLLKAGHTHGMPFALYNLIIGGLVDRLALSGGRKKWLSYLAVGTFIMPVGLILRGLTGGAMTFAPVVMIGALCFLGSAALLFIGARAAKE